jgi:hypothetical protein
MVVLVALVAVKAVSRGQGPAAGAPEKETP